MWGFYDSYYFILVIPAFIIAALAQLNVSNTFRKYSNIFVGRGITANSAVEAILRNNNISDVSIEHIRGNLSDHYDPRTNIIRLSDTVYGQSSVGAIGVAAHETGHAVQHSVNYLPIRIRSFLVPIANIGSTAGMALAFIGLFMGSGFQFLTNIGILLFSGAVLFYLVTLPVEFNASSRAVAALSDMGMFTEEEIKGVKKVLGAAAMTYVAAALTSIANLLRLILLSRSRRD